MANIAKRINARLGAIFYQFAQKSSHVYWIRSADFQSQYYISPGYEALWGRSCADLCNNPSLWIDTLVVEDRDKFRQYLMELQAHPLDECHTTQYRIMHPSGKIITIKDMSMPIFDGRECIAFVGMSGEVRSHLGYDYQDYSNQFFQFLYRFVKIFSHIRRDPALL